MELLVEVSRSEIVESRHYGHIVVVNNKGEILYSAGKPEMVTYFRSAAKPLQAVPLVKSGAYKYFSLAPKHLAVMTGSHTGEEMHCKTIKEILTSIEVEENNLKCGVQWPAKRETANNLIKAGLKPTPLHNNCSGKHAGMLALSKFKGWPIKEYWKLEHPVQQEMLLEVAEMCNYPKEKINIGIDGCGVPVFGMPLINMALGYANLVTCDANKEVVNAMISFPEMVFGPAQFDTELMNLTGDLVAKAGVEAVYCIGLVDKGLGIAIKIEDGSFRAIAPTAVEVLSQLKVLNDDILKKLLSFHRPYVKNKRKEIVGEIRPVFKLVKH